MMVMHAQLRVIDPATLQWHQASIRAFHAPSSSATRSGIFWGQPNDTDASTNFRCGPKSGFTHACFPVLGLATDDNIELANDRDGCWSDLPAVFGSDQYRQGELQPERATLARLTTNAHFAAHLLYEALGKRQAKTSATFRAT